MGTVCAYIQQPSLQTRFEAASLVVVGAQSELFTTRTTETDHNIMIAYWHRNAHSTHSTRLHVSECTSTHTHTNRPRSVACSAVSVGVVVVVVVVQMQNMSVYLIVWKI